MCKERLKVPEVATQCHMLRLQKSTMSTPDVMVHSITSFVMFYAYFCLWRTWVLHVHERSLQCPRQWCTVHNYLRKKQVLQIRRIGITSANTCFERPITAIFHNISFHTLIVHNHHNNNNKVLTLTPSGFLGCVNMKSKVVSMFAIFMAALKRKTIQGSYLSANSE